MSNDKEYRLSYFLDFLFIKLDKYFIMHAERSAL